MNIIIRRCLGMLNLVQVKRDYFDAKAAQDIPVTFASSLKKTTCEKQAMILNYKEPLELPRHCNAYP